MASVVHPAKELDSESLPGPAVFESRAPSNSQVLLGSRIVSLATLLAIAVGVALRVIVFLSPRSLWQDEAAVALNLIDRTAWQLLGRLDNEQYAPVGFLLVTKGIAFVSGYTEHALRAFSLACGLAFPVLMWRLARRTCGAAGTFVVTALASIAAPLIAHSNQLKPYSADAVVTVCLLLLYEVHRGLEDEGVSMRAEFARAILASLLILFSFPAIFTLVAILVSRIVFLNGQRRLSVTANILMGATPWLVVFGVYFTLSLANASTTPWLQQFWDHAFLSANPSLFYIRRNIDLMTTALGQNVGLHPLLVLFVLAIAVPKGLRDRKRVAVTLIGIVVLTAIASGLRRWPLEVRLVLFAAPVPLLFVGWAVDALTELRLRAVAALAVAALLYGPATAAKDLVDSSRTPQGLRATGEALGSRYREGDVVYLYYLLNLEQELYQRLGAFPDVPIVRSTNLMDHAWSDCEQQVSSLPAASRVWFVVGNSRQAPFNERDAILESLAKQRKQLERVSDQLYLFGPIEG